MNSNDSLSTSLSNRTNSHGSGYGGFRPSQYETYPILIALSILAGIGNLGTIWAFCSSATVRRKPSDMILLSLACADFGVATFMLPRIIYVQLAHYWPFGEIGCRFSSLISGTLVVAGEYTVILLSWDRYRMLTMDYSKYMKWHTSRFTAAAVAITWFISSLKGLIDNAIWNWALNSLPPNQGPNYSLRCRTPGIYKARWVLFNMCLSITRVLAVAMLGVLIIVKLHKRLRQFQRVGDVSSSARQETSNTNNSTVSTVSTSNANASRNASSNLNKNDDARAVMRKRYIKPVITYIALVASLLICTLPSITLQVLTHFYPHIFYTRSTASTTLMTISLFNCLRYFNSCINPCLYALTNARIREFYIKQFRNLRRLIAR